MLPFKLAERTLFQRAIPDTVSYLKLSDRLLRVAVERTQRLCDRRVLCDVTRAALTVEKHGTFVHVGYCVIFERRGPQILGTVDVGSVEVS